MNKNKALHSKIEENHRAPRWVKVMGITLIVLVLLMLLVMLFGGGDHGPGRHLSSLNAIEQGLERL